MMYEHEKSDPNMIAGKPANKAVSAAAEWVERRAGTEGNAGGQSTLRAQDRERVSQALGRTPRAGAPFWPMRAGRAAAKERKTERFTSLLHHVDATLLTLSFAAIRRDAAPGVDGVTWADYAADLDRNLTDLRDRVHRGAYRALPSRRVTIPKADGKQRPLARCRRRLRLWRGAGGQDRPAGLRHGAEQHLRGRRPRVQRSLPRPSWLANASRGGPSGTGAARRARCLGRCDR